MKTTTYPSRLRDQAPSVCSTRDHQHGDSTICPVAVHGSSRETFPHRQRSQIHRIYDLEATAPLPSKLHSFTLVLSLENDIKSFDADYVITNDESPYPQKGKLRFEVKPSD